MFRNEYHVFLKSDKNELSFLMLDLKETWMLMKNVKVKMLFLTTVVGSISNISMHLIDSNVCFH